MPVPAHIVPLDTAKTWAKRLAKTSKTLTPDTPLKLTQCQLAVAQMLGYEHWHALQTHLSAPSGSVVQTPGQAQANVDIQHKFPKALDARHADVSYWDTLLKQKNVQHLHIFVRTNIVQKPTDLSMEALRPHLDRLTAIHGHTFEQQLRLDGYVREVIHRQNAVMVFHATRIDSIEGMVGFELSIRQTPMVSNQEVSGPQAGLS